MMTEAEPERASALLLPVGLTSGWDYTRFQQRFKGMYSFIQSGIAPSNDSVAGGTMSHTDRMDIDERRKYLDKVQPRSQEANRPQKGRLLDEMVAVTGLHRKTLIGHVNFPLDGKERCRERGKSYGPDVDDTLRVITESHDDICAERLQPNLVPMAEQLASHGELVVTEALLDQLGRISVSTVQRRLSRLRQDEPQRRRDRGAAKPSGLLHQVPMGRIPWDVGEPGHFEVDLVHHCGSSASGLYICTLQMLDVATGWTERAAVLGRSAVRRAAVSQPPLPQERQSLRGAEQLQSGAGLPGRRTPRYRRADLVHAPPL
jgi:hypothetical protein